METITRGSMSRIGFVVVDEKRQFCVEKDWMDDFAGWLAWTLLKQRIQCRVNVLYLHAKRENFSVLFKLQSSF